MDCLSHDMQNCLLRVLMHGHQIMFTCDGRACACAGTVFEKAHARMKRIYKIAGQGQRRRRKSSLAYIDSCSR